MRLWRALGGGACKQVPAGDQSEGASRICGHHTKPIRELGTEEPDSNHGSIKHNLGDLGLNVQLLWH